MHTPKILKKVMAKLSGPMLGSFYILKGNLYYSTIHTGLLHPDLWKIIVKRVFSGLDKEYIETLTENSFGIDRGRVSWKGEMDHTYEKPVGEGNYLLEASSGCAKYEDLIKKTFNLQRLDSKQLETHYTSEGSYKIVPSDKKLIENTLEKFEPKLENTHIASK